MTNIILKYWLTTLNITLFFVFSRSNTLFSSKDFDCLIEFRMDRPEKRVIFDEAPTPEKFEVVDINVFVVGSTDLPQLFP